MKKVLLFALTALTLGSLLAGELFTKAPVIENTIIPLARAPKLSTHTQYYFQPKSSIGMQLDIQKDYALGNVQLWPVNASFAQRFFFSDTSFGRYHIIKGKHLTYLTTELFEDNLSPVMSEKNDSPYALWHVIPSGETDYYYIINDTDGMALTDNSENQKNEIILDKLTGVECQKWRMLPVHNK